MEKPLVVKKEHKREHDSAGSSAGMLAERWASSKAGKKVEKSVAWWDDKKVVRKAVAMVDDLAEMKGAS